MLTDFPMPQARIGGLRRSRSFSDLTRKETDDTWKMDKSDSPTPLHIEEKMKRSQSFSDVTCNGDEEHFWKIDKSFTQGITRDSPFVKGTTLLDIIPYDGIDKDEGDYVKEKFKYVQAQIQDPTFGTDETCPHIKLYKLTGFHPGIQHINGGPVIQVISVNIFNTSPVWKGSEIYGQISIVGDKNMLFPVFNREANDPQAVSADGELSLLRFPVAPGTWGKITLSLFVDGGAQIFTKGSDANVKYDCYSNKVVEELTIQGESGFYARVVYTIIPFATIAEVSMQLIGPPDAKLDRMRVGGEITANFEKYRIAFLKNDEFKVLIKDEKQYIFPIPQSRASIAVPVYSTLPIEFSLTRNGNAFASGTLETDACLPSGFGLFHQCIDPNYHIGVFVDWDCPDQALNLNPLVEDPVTSDHYVEVFSVIVGCVNASKPPPALCGSIVIADKKETVYVFSRTANCPDNLSQFKRRVSLTWPTDRWVLEKEFYMHLKLKDVQGLPVCRGSVSWYRDSDEFPSRFDRRMCAVIRGENGYFAAVHYAIFKNGLRAKVTVNVDCGCPCDSFDVYGSVFAEYDNYDYLSAYDKEYNRVIIFDRPEEYRAKIINCSEIPLSKSLVTAPADCTELSVFVNLNVRVFNFCHVSSSDLVAINRLRFPTSTNSTQRMRMYRRGEGGICRLGYVIVAIDWFDRSHGYRVVE